MLAYRAANNMHKMSESEPKYLFNWKIVAQMIGWAGILITFGIIILYGPVALIFLDFVYCVVFLVMCGMFLIQVSNLFLIRI